MPEKSIAHVDMNAFYAACHAAQEPDKYAGKPTAVSGSPQTRHGVVVTASYEARRRGVRATMTVAQALAVCPELILIHPDFELYRSYSKRAFEIVRNYTPAIEIFSIDECFADLTGSGQFGPPIEIAKQIQSRLQKELDLPCSIGLGPNKLLAKMASDMKKPLGITEIQMEDVPKVLWPLPVNQLFGIGPKTAHRLQINGIRTIGQLAAADGTRLYRLFGKHGLEVAEAARGIGSSEVATERAQNKQIGHSITLPEDISDGRELRTVLLNLSDSVGRRVRKHGLVGKTVQLTVRFANRKTITRAKTLDVPTALTEDLYQTTCELLARHVPEGSRIRLLGVSMGQLSRPVDVPRQSSLFEDQVAHEREKHRINQHVLTTAVDALRDKYGEGIVIRGRMLKPHVSSQLRDGKNRGTSLQKDNLE